MFTTIISYWKDHLRGKPYHISALYVVDLQRFRYSTICPALSIIIIVTMIMMMLIIVMMMMMMMMISLDATQWGTLSAPLTTSSLGRI
jgi:hypothetical protein